MINGSIPKGSLSSRSKNERSILRIIIAITKKNVSTVSGRIKDRIFALKNVHKLNELSIAVSTSVSYIQSFSLICCVCSGVFLILENIISWLFPIDINMIL